MDWHEIIGIIAGLLQISAVIPYIKEILHGSTRPNIVSFALWTFIQTITIAAQLSAGASWSVILLFATTLGTGTIVVLCLMGYGYTEYGITDAMCFVLALVAIIAWQITKQPLVGFILSLAADFIAYIPTFIKTYRHPESEAVFPWLLIVCAAALAAFSTTKLDLANLLYPIYVFIMDGAVVSLAFWGQRALKRRVVQVST